MWAASALQLLSKAWRRAAVTIAGLVVVCGCGRIAFDPSSDRSDASPDAVWTTRQWRIATPAHNPGGRWGPRLVYAPDRRTVLLYGGTAGDPNVGTGARADLWEYDGSDWTQICAACPPGPRTRFGLTYDTARARLVVFGGLDDTFTARNDLWEWDGTAWTQVTPTGTVPTARHSFFTAYDPDRGRVVVFGGFTSAATNEVYEYDGATWSQPTPAAPPSPRFDGSFMGTYDSIRRELLVYGDAGTFTDDLWGWDGTTWRRRCDGCIGNPRQSGMLVFDPARDRVVLSNGWRGANNVAGTYELDGTGWNQTSPDLPPARDTFGYAYDPIRDRIVIYGGNGDSCFLSATVHCDETWEYVRAP